MNDSPTTNDGSPITSNGVRMFTLALMSMVATGVFVNHQHKVKLHQFKSEAIEAGAAEYVCDPTTGVVRWEWRKCK